MVGRAGWKKFEREAAAAVGARRIPVTGRHGPGADPGDMELPGFYVEVRDRQRARPLRWMLEAWREARGTGRRPLVVFKGPANYLSPLVVMRWADFAEVYRRGQPAAAAGPDPERPGAAPAGAPQPPGG